MDHSSGEEYDVHAHVTSVRTYILVFAALLALTGLTVLAYNVRLGDYNLLVAVLIATLKASLVCTWFMHLKYEKAFNTAFFVGSLIFVGVFFAYTMNDTSERTRVNEFSGGRIDPKTGGYTHGTAPVLAEQGSEELSLEAKESSDAAEPGSPE